MKVEDHHLNADESCVLQFLKNWPDTFISAAEIARRADGKTRHRTEPRWAAPILGQLVTLKLAETDGHGKFRLVTGGMTVKHGGKKRFVAPHLRAILEKHERKFDFSH